ncbi:hypothetical protein sphantq_01488 [Sphingobium sp. AntQ-1]|nr:hypothetical protein sphantq_01488 [Sphingobium sp. AntQ-1]
MTLFFFGSFYQKSCFHVAVECYRTVSRVN